MSKTAQQRSKSVGLLSIIILSSLSMLWFCWHHPVTAVIVSGLVIATLVVSARLARLIDADGRIGSEPRA